MRDLPALAVSSGSDSPKWAGWEKITAAAPQMTATMWRYLDQTTTFLAPTSVISAEGALHKLA
jgi:hypothetical protein